MLVKVDIQHKNGKTEALIFGHEKGGRDWKSTFSFYMIQNFVKNRLNKEAPIELPEILKVEQATGNSPKNFLWCRPSDWSRLTKTTLPKFKEATSRTRNGIEKKYEEILKKGKGGTDTTRSSRTRNEDSGDEQEQEEKSASSADE